MWRRQEKEEKETEQDGKLSREMEGKGEGRGGRETTERDGCKAKKEHERETKPTSEREIRGY